MATTKVGPRGRLQPPRLSIAPGALGQWSISVLRIPQPRLTRERPSVDSNGATGRREPDHQRHHAQPGRWNAIKSWNAFLRVALAGRRSADTVPNTTPISAEKTHAAQTANSTARVPTQIEDKPIARRIRHGAAHVARHVHSENPRKHADSNKADPIGQSRRHHHLIGHNKRAILFLWLRITSVDWIGTPSALRTVMSYCP